MFRLMQIKQIGGIFIHLKVVGRGSETQIQVGENVNYITKRSNQANTTQCWFNVGPPSQTVGQR